MPQNPMDDRSKLIQVMAWCRPATGRHLKHCSPGYMTPYGVTMPQWIYDWYIVYIPYTAYIMYLCFAAFLDTIMSQLIQQQGGQINFIWHIYGLGLGHEEVLWWFDVRHNHGDVHYFFTIVYNVSHSFVRNIVFITFTTYTWQCCMKPFSLSCLIKKKKKNFQSRELISLQNNVWEIVIISNLYVIYNWHGRVLSA